METTLCLLKKDNSILLAMKKRGFGSGKYNGIGGKIEKGETPDEAMIRETKEEIKVAFRQKARKLHPDVNKAPDAEERFKELGKVLQRQ